MREEEVAPRGCIVRHKRNEEQNSTAVADAVAGQSKQGPAASYTGRRRKGEMEEFTTKQAREKKAVVGEEWMRDGG